MRRVRGLILVLGVAVLFLLPLLPETLGARRLVFRDAQITHWPWRRVAMAALSAGEIPVINPSASGGEPLLANPNAVLLYPTVLFEKILTPAAAFNLHYLVHVLWAFLGACALARRLGLAPGPAFFAGIAFAFSGMMLSYASAFANSGAAAAWTPWCAAAAVDLARAADVRRGVRAAAALGIAFGLQLLAGEPALTLLTAILASLLAAGEILGAAPGERAASLRRLAGGGLLAGLSAAALAAALLLPLRSVLPLTYRGQHLYSERAFGASPFAAWRALEWFFPRFGGDPGQLGPGAHWQYALHAGDLVYIWCVTFGVVPLLAILVASLRRDFWNRRVILLASVAVVSLLFAFGSSLPFFRALGAIEFLRRMRYPIKFYLVTTACVALLSGFAVAHLRELRAGAGARRREIAALTAAGALYAAAFFAAGPDGLLDRAVRPLLGNLALSPAALLPAIRRSFRGDAVFGLAAAVAVAVFLLARRPSRGAAHALAFAALLLAFPWGLPLFVSADERVLERPPAILAALGDRSGVFLSPRLAEFNVLATGTAHPRLSPTVSRLSRVQIEELIPQTGAPFQVRYVFDSDPDGSYGYYNRLCSESLAAATPAERGRILRIYGARWMLADEGEGLPSLESVTGFEVAGRRLELFRVSEPLAELRWTGREHRRRSLSGALELIRSPLFRPETDVVLPGALDSDPPAGAPTARLTATRIASDRAAARVASESAGYVLFSRTYFPTWKARVDGSAVPVSVANARDLAVRVPRGEHEVEFEFDRSPFRRGVAVQSLGLVLIASVLAGTSRRSRKS